MKFFCPVLALFLAVLTLAPSQSFAEYDKEMQYLHMYFSEDELVVSSSRALKPLSEVAENMTIVTADEIRDMNAHTIDEVLDRVTGVYVSFQGHDFASTALSKIQGSDYKHVLFMLDGVALNNISSSELVTNAIPVGIIKRIEIIKGPASSAWGSSLGGVINIITKDPGSKVRPEVTLSGSYGKNSSQDYRADAAGMAGKAGYYIYAGRQYSDGLKNGRSVENNIFYTKLEMPVSIDSTLTISAGHTKPLMDFGTLGYITATGEQQYSFATASYCADISDSLNFEVSLNYIKDVFIANWEPLDGSFDLENESTEQRYTGGARLVYAHKMHTAVFGMDLNENEYKKTDLVTRDIKDEFTLSKWAVYANDTISLGSLSITPGIRYDYNEDAGSFVSPSLGITQMIMENTIFRASVAKGFYAQPPLYLKGNYKYIANPDLEPESVWSYQASLESIIQRSLRARVNIFYHDQKDGFQKVASKFENTKKKTREGIEVEFVTAPFHDISISSGAGYVYIDNDEAVNEERYTVNAALKYDDKKSFMAEISANYMYWDPDNYEDAADDVLCDLNMRKSFKLTNELRSELFLTVHNIFNGSNYWGSEYENPSQWAEGGVRFSF